MEKERKKPADGRRITFRLTEKEWQKLEELRKRSYHRSISSLIRKSLFSGRIKLIAYDPSLDRIMEELSAVRAEIQAIGVNINQATRRLHQSATADGRLLSAMEITRLYQQTDSKVTELFTLISKLSGRWLPE